MLTVQYMEKKTITYVCHYNTPLSAVDRKANIAGVRKMDYIISVLQRSGYNVHVVSIVGASNKRIGFHKGEFIKVDDSLTIQFLSSISGGGVLMSLIKRFWSKYMLLHTLLKLNRDSTVIVYHSLYYYDVIIKAKQKRDFKLLLEVEEIYQDVSKLSKNMIRYEYPTIYCADSYLFPTEMLNEKLNGTHKPAIIVYGTYLIENRTTERFNDGNIHVIYSGTFDPNKGGAIAAVDCAKYLPHNYIIHIAGAGSDVHQKSLMKRIEEINLGESATIVFEGCILYDEYNKLLQKCHIGLSSQTAIGVYNETSFPSKILSYLSNDLIVVSSPSSAVLRSKLSAVVHFSEDSTPESIAKAIMNVDINHNNSGNTILQELDRECILDVRNLLG